MQNLAKLTLPFVFLLSMKLQRLLIPVLSFRHNNPPRSNDGRIRGRYKMKIRITVWLPLLMFAASSPAALAIGKAHPQTKDQAAQSSATDTEKKNVQEYIELIRTNVRDPKRRR
jgi:hypothetical protein